MKKKRMTTKGLITALRSQGVNVDYRKRSDGGYIIKKIGKEKFTGASGNNYARQVLGITLSKKQLTQRKRAFNESPLQFTGDIRTQIRLTNNAYENSDEESFNNREKPAKTNIRTIRNDIRRMGRERALQRLTNNQRRAMGYAYPINVDALIERLKVANSSGKFTDAINRIYAKRNSFRDATLRKINDVLYSLEDKKNPEYTLEIAVDIINALV